MFSSVVFPVPFFATRATRRPSSIVNEIFSKSTCSPYDLVRFSTWRQEAITCDLDLQSYAKIPNRANRRPGKGPRPPENGLPLPEKRTAHDGHIPSCAVSRCRPPPETLCRSGFHPSRRHAFRAVPFFRQPPFSRVAGSRYGVFSGIGSLPAASAFPDTRFQALSFPRPAFRAHYQFLRRSRVRGNSVMRSVVQP